MTHYTMLTIKQQISILKTSISIMLTATDQKPQKSLNAHITQHHVDIWGNVMVGNITFLMVFAVFDPSPLTLWIHCSF